MNWFNNVMAFRQALIIWCFVLNISHLKYQWWPVGVNSGHVCYWAKAIVRFWANLMTALTRCAPHLPQWETGWGPRWRETSWQTSTTPSWSNSTTVSSQPDLCSDNMVKNHRAGGDNTVSLSDNLPCGHRGQCPPCLYDEWEQFWVL